MSELNIPKEAYTAGERVAVDNGVSGPVAGGLAYELLQIVAPLIVAANQDGTRAAERLRIASWARDCHRHCPTAEGRATWEALIDELDPEGSTR